ncbi:MAG: hypothetical protein HKM07_02295 [Chlamydiae bacterium]|nr:hypothetical protein [Chlamydiota bacterium]
MLSVKHSLFPMPTSAKEATWYEQVKATIPKSRYKLDLSSYTKDEALQVHETFIKEIMEAYNKLPNRTQIPPLFDSTNSSNVSMSGLAVIVTYLREKKGIKNLFVCETKEALQVELERVSKSKGDLRAAYIIPVCHYENLSDEELKEEETFDPETKHIVTVGIEKIGSSIKIVLFESLGTAPHEFNPRIIHSDAKELTNADIDFGSGIVWYLYHSNLDMNTTSVYFSSSRRQRTGNSCETFATRDAIDFLLCPDFFSLIGIKRIHIENTKTKKSIDAIQIKSLPPVFMKSTQSVSAIQRYVEKHPTLAPRSFHYLDRTQTLADSLAKHRIVLQTKKNDSIEEKGQKDALISDTIVLSIIGDTITKGKITNESTEDPKQTITISSQEPSSGKRIEIVLPPNSIESKTRTQKYSSGYSSSVTTGWNSDSDDDGDDHISVTPIKSSRTSEINDYLFRRSRKYKLMLLETCQILPPGQIREIIAKSLIQAPAKVDQEIRTLNDLRYEQEKKFAELKIKSRL